MKNPTEKLKIDHNNLIQKFKDDTFELHIGTTGPMGANVYFFDKFTRLIGKQRRSPDFWTEVRQPKFE